MITIFIGAVIGALLGGPYGALFGGAVGWFVGQFVRQSIVGNLQLAQSELVESTFSIMGAISKADGVVTRDEIDAVEQMFGMLRLEGEMRVKAKAAFNRGKQRDFELDAAVDQFATVTRRRAPLVQLFLQMQVMAVAADGVIHPAEHAMLVRIARRLGLTERDVSQLEALLRATQAGPSTPGGPPPADRLADAYAALGVTANSNGAEIKRAYRKLISKNHPDKLASRGLPESMRAVAEERSREINSAYDLIKSARPDVK
jgi:DnaJ like chaperone protein